ncbi:MAG: flagellar biosynthetic protein FliQ [Paludibaculum sp.]
MTPESVVNIIREALLLALMLGAPLLLVGFVVGAAVSLFQVATSIQDNAVGTVPRLAAILGTFLVILPWMLSRMITYAASIFGDLGEVCPLSSPSALRLCSASSPCSCASAASLPFFRCLDSRKGRSPSRPSSPSASRSPSCRSGRHCPPAPSTPASTSLDRSSEAAFGIAVGLCLAVVMEVFLLTAQVLSLQSGLSYASSVDPNSLADSGALTLTANLTAGLLLFATGLHRQIIQALARSLELLPPGSFVIQRATLVDLLQYSPAPCSPPDSAWPCPSWPSCSCSTWPSRYRPHQSRTPALQPLVPGQDLPHALHLLPGAGAVLPASSNASPIAA